MGFLNDIVEMEPILQGLTARGIPIDEAARLRLREGLETEMRELFTKMQNLVPLELRNVEPKQGYVKGVKVQPGRIEEDGNGGYRWFDPGDADSPAMWWPMMQRSFVALNDESDREFFTRWCRVMPFRPSGGPKGQVLRYVKHMGYKVPRTKKEDKETSDKQGLETLIRQHPKDELLPAIRAYRDVEKLKSTYVDGWKPARDGRVHPQFHNKPATGQLSCVAGWTPVTTKRGIIPISEVTVGDLVLTHRMRWRPVLAVWSKGKSPMVEVRFSNGEVLTCTSDHKLLCLTYEHKQTMANSREHSESFDLVPLPRSANIGDHSPRIEDHGSYRELGDKQSCAVGRTRSPKEDPLLTLQDSREEPNVWEARRRSSQLDRTCGRWLRISDLLERWGATICSPDSHGRDAWAQEAPKILGRSSYRRESEEQSSGQSGFSDQSWTFRDSYSDETGLQDCRITKIDCVGSHEVYDITVAQDESYETCGVFSHNSSQPNAQNVPNAGKSPKMAALFRPIIAARPDRVLIEFDYKSFHALTTGFEARDPDWMRLARLDIHSYVAGVLLGRWKPDFKVMPDLCLMDSFSAEKKDPKFKYVRDKQAKPSILGVGFGMQAHRLWKENEETIKGRKEAQALLDTLHALFPRVFKWQDEIRDLAHRQNYLVSRHGWMRWFWDVKHWNGEKGDWVNGDDSEKCIAFLPANDAHCMLKATLRRLQEQELLERFGFINTIHDSLLFECPRALEDNCMAIVKAEMERPSEVLVDPVVAPSGLSVEVEIKVGKNWQEMREIR